MAWSHTMANRAVIAIPITQKNIAARFLEQHECKIFGAHSWINAVVYIFISHQISHDFGGKLNLCIVIDERWVITTEFNFCLALESAGNVM